MNKYEVTDKATGKSLEIYFAEQPIDPRPFWGTPEHDEQQQDGNGIPVLNPDGTPATVTVPATYQVVVTDVTYDFELQDCWANRLREYPAVGDQLDARFKAEYLADSTQLNSVHAQIAAVKAKYPKPTPPQGT